ncbi:unnamed protein product [Heligmosomoides polygyrus]|uniref:PlsC domain-containing protein n=1 Tax=Heligmosomoides polygyrus TaxID=6339 RepID=A0A183GR15_HELPZ|nr:unnamed protein product [Heligmosomoides polygyrus]
MISMKITTSIIIVWHDAMPDSRPMRQVLICLERQLQCGGAIAFFPSPYEDDSAQEWDAMERVCADQALDTVTYIHPALILGAHPRNGKAPFIGRQILCFLEKLRLSVHDLIKIGQFVFASKDDRERRWLKIRTATVTNARSLSTMQTVRAIMRTGIVSCIVIEAKGPFAGPSSRTLDHAEPSSTPHGQGAARWIIAAFESRPPPDHV